MPLILTFNHRLFSNIIHSVCIHDFSVVFKWKQLINVFCTFVYSRIAHDFWIIWTCPHQCFNSSFVILSKVWEDPVISATGITPMVIGQRWWCHCLNYSQVYSLGFFTFQAISTGYEEKVIVAVWFGNFHKASPTPSLIHWSPSLSVCLWLCTMIFAFLSKSAAARFGGHHEGHGNLVYLVLLSTSHLNVAI